MSSWFVVAILVSMWLLVLVISYHALAHSVFTGLTRGVISIVVASLSILSLMRTFSSNPGDRNISVIDFILIPYGAMGLTLLIVLVLLLVLLLVLCVPVSALVLAASGREQLALPDNDDSAPQHLERIPRRGALPGCQATAGRLLGQFPAWLHSFVDPHEMEPIARGDRLRPPSEGQLQCVRRELRAKLRGELRFCRER